MNVQEFFLFVNQFFTFYFVFPAIVVLGIFLTVKLNFLQVTKMKRSILSLLQGKGKGEGNISHYEAVAAVVAGNLGTGNISGMAVALTTGGPGSLVWMWVMAFLGSIIQYSSCFLGVKYRSLTASGEYVGGPMYYLKQGLGMKKTAICFSLFTLLAALTVGSLAQINSIVLPLKTLGFNPLLCGLVIMVAAGLTLIGGVQRIAKVAASIVPVMAILYMGACLVILLFHKSQIIPGIGIMFKSAFQLSSFAGGALGFTLVKALSTGFDRGIFATDAGTGIVPILQSGARSQGPVPDGIVTFVAPFLVMIVCSMTGLALIVTGAFEKAGLESTNMVVFAFQKVFGEGLGMSIVILSLSLFAYTTVIAWGGCGEKAAEFLWSRKKSKIFQYIYLASIPLGAIARVDFVWIFADFSIALMLVTNLIGITGLSKEVIAESTLFFQKEKKPLF